MRQYPRRQRRRLFVGLALLWCTITHSLVIHRVAVVGSSSSSRPSLQALSSPEQSIEASSQQETQPKAGPLALNLAMYEAKELQELQWLVRTTSEFLARTDASPPLTKGQVHRLHRLLRAWARRSARPGSPAPSVVERIVSRLGQERDQSGAAMVDTTVYNIVLEAWSSSDAAGAAERATTILSRMEALADQGHEELRPNVDSYNACIKAYVGMHGEDAVEQAQALLERMEARSESDPTLRPNRRGYNLFLYALAHVTADDAAPRAQAILQRMMRAAQEGNEAARPDINSYNQVLTCWARGRCPDFETAMQTIYEELIQQGNMSPNTGTFNTVMGGWLRSSRPDAVSRLFETLTAMQESFAAGNGAAQPDCVSLNTAMAAFVKQQDDCIEQVTSLRERMERQYGIEADTVSYNTLIDAWSKSRRSDAPDNVLAILESLEQSFQRGKRHLKPDAYTYNSIIDCLVKCDVTKAPEKAEKLLHRMKTLHLRYRGDPPVTSVYNAGKVFANVCERYGINDRLTSSALAEPVINAWACSGSIQAVRRVESILNDMESSKDGTVPAPDTITYNTVIKAMSHGTRDEATRAEQILQQLEQRSLADKSLLADEYTYTAVIAAYARSDAESKAEKAYELLRRLVKAFRKREPPLKPKTTAFNAALNACAFVRGDAPAKKAAFAILISIMGLLKRNTKPDHTTYGTILRACSSLLPPFEKKRALVVDSIFRQAAQEGLVGRLVLTQLRFAASLDHYELLTGFSPKERISLSDLPREWTCNVREHPKMRKRHNDR